MNRLHGGIGVLSFLVLLVMALPASAGSVMMLKGGNFKWLDEKQETAEYDVRYESRSGVYALGFENRRRSVAMGVEIMRLESDWKAVDPAALRPKGQLELQSVSFVPRKYFRTQSDFYPFIGVGIGWSYVRSQYITPTGKDIEREDGAILQLNVGGEWRWEEAGLMVELKRVKADIEDSSLSLAKDDFPDVSGLIGFVGLTLMF